MGVLPADRRGRRRLDPAGRPRHLRLRARRRGRRAAGRVLRRPAAAPRAAARADGGVRRLQRRQRARARPTARCWWPGSSTGCRTAATSASPSLVAASMVAARSGAAGRSRCVLHRAPRRQRRRRARRDLAGPAPRLAGGVLAGRRALGTLTVAAGRRVRAALPGQPRGDRAAGAAALRLPAGVARRCWRARSASAACSRVFTYIAPIVTEVGGLPESAVPVFLLAFGLGHGRSATGWPAGSPTGRCSGSLIGSPLGLGAGPARAVLAHGPARLGWRCPPRSWSPRWARCSRSA